MIYAATTRLVEAALRLRVALGGQADLRQRLAIGAPPARCRALQPTDAFLQGLIFLSNVFLSKN